ncbi:MAG: hypothetical protein EOP73_03435 [Variovorax sp.]|nr:MAG: hypothetical protein EOP73_03435 [Variovorax sp.]
MVRLKSKRFDVTSHAPSTLACWPGTDQHDPSNSNHVSRTLGHDTRHGGSAGSAMKTLTLAKRRAYRTPVVGARRNPATRRWALPPKRVVAWSVVSALPMAIIVTLGAYLSYHGHALLVDSRTRVDHTQQVLSALNRVFISVEDAETGQRGYVITGQESYLAPYTIATQALPLAYAELHGLTAASPEQSERLAILQGVIERKLDELGRVVVIRREAGFAEAAKAIANDEGKGLMDDVRDEIRRIEHAERDRLALLQREAQASERNLLNVGMIVAGLSVTVRLSLALLLARLRRRRARS